MDGTHCLIQLETGWWGGTAKLSEESLAKIGDPNWLSGKKSLVDYEDIKGPQNIVAIARKRITSLSAPFPIRSLSMVSKDLIETIDQQLSGHKIDFWLAVDEIVGNWYWIKQKARPKLEEAGIWTELEYPSDIKSKYKFTWRFLDIATPNGNLLSPSIYAEEKRKFEELMKETRELAAFTFRQELVTLVQHMVDRLGTKDGKPNKFKDSIITNFISFFETIESRDVFKDSELVDLCAMAKDAINGITPDSLRDDDYLRKQIQSKMIEVRSVLNESLETMPRRKLTFEEAA